MKKIIGIILLILFFVAIAVGTSILFCFCGVNWVVSILLTLGAFVAAALIIGFAELVGWLLS